MPSSWCTWPIFVRPKPGTRRIYSNSGFELAAERIVVSLRDDNLRVALHLYNVEDDVDRALVELLAECATVTADAVKARCAPSSAPAVPSLEAPAVDLAAYDSLLVEVAS